MSNLKNYSLWDYPDSKITIPEHNAYKVLFLFQVKDKSQEKIAITIRQTSNQQEDVTFQIHNDIFKIRPSSLVRQVEGESIYGTTDLIRDTYIFKFEEDKVTLCRTDNEANSYEVKIYKYPIEIKVEGHEKTMKSVRIV